MVTQPQLVDVALKINVGAVIRRLGFLLELFEMEAFRRIRHDATTPPLNAKEGVMERRL